MQFRKFPNLRHLDLSGIAFTNEGQDFPPNMEYLRFHTGVASWDFLMPDLDLFKNLKTLIFNDVNWIRPLSLQKILSNTTSTLSILSLDSCVNMGLGLRECTERGYFDHLTELSLSRLSKVDDDLLQMLLVRMYQVKALHLSYTAVTGRTVKMLADARVSEENKAAKVGRVFLKGCESVSSDAVAYGRARGLEVFI